MAQGEGREEQLVQVYFSPVKAVKYEISVELVKELQTESVAYVRSLPVGMENPDGIKEVKSEERRVKNKSN